MKQRSPSQEHLPIALFKIAANRFGILGPDCWIFAENSLYFSIGAHDMLKDIVSVVIRRAITAWFKLGNQLNHEPDLGHLLEVGKRSLCFSHPKKLCPYSFSGRLGNKSSVLFDDRKGLG
ncbi:MAG: hypothetical protein V3V47_01100 [Desulfobacteria bacterium]